MARRPPALPEDFARMTSTESDAFLSCQGISKSWKGRAFLQDINLSVRKNERLAIVGASGAGKTTLLRIMAGLEDASGIILLDGRPLPAYSRMESPVGMVFQRPAVYPHLTVRENLSFPLEQRKKSKSEIEERTRHLAELLHLTALLDRPASLLSGGEMQRVAIGRALAHPPKVLLLDEPFANLHQSLRWRMVDYIRGLHREYSLTTVLVTHEPGDAMYFADRIAVMGNGKILQLGDVAEVVRAPASLEIAQLLFDPPPNIFQIPASANAPQTTAVWRPTDTKIDPTGNGVTIADDLVLSGTVHDQGHYNDQTLLSVKIGDAIIRALVPHNDCPAMGTKVELRVEKSSLHLFETGTGRRLA